MQRSGRVVVERLTKTFPRSHTAVAWLRHRGRPPRFVAVADVSFTAGPGELFGLLGANGAGKSTILQVLCGLTTPDAGGAWINGVSAAASSIELRRQLGFCSAEERSFYFRLTARQNLEFFGALQGLRGRALRRRIDEVAALVDLSESIDRRLEGFSSGMRQRIAIARALLTDADILLFDEPTRAVDPVHAAEIRRFIRSLAAERGKTVVLCTNVLEEAWEMCDRVAMLAEGRLVTIARPEELTLGTGRRYAIAIHGRSEDFVAKTGAVPGVRRVERYEEEAGTLLRVELDDGARTLTELLRAVSGNGVSIRDVRPETVRPLDAFMRLAMGDRVAL